jgi:hypothetical protein
VNCRAKKNRSQTQKRPYCCLASAISNKENGANLCEMTGDFAAADCQMLQGQKRFTNRAKFALDTAAIIV